MAQVPIAYWLEELRLYERISYLHRFSKGRYQPHRGLLVAPRSPNRLSQHLQAWPIELWNRWDNIQVVSGVLSLIRSELLAVKSV